MFPHTDKRRKIGMISFRLRTKWQNCRGYVPRYERPPKNGWFDIHSVFATHVETVILLSRKTPDAIIEIDLEMSELDLTRAESKATYKEIEEYVQNKYGLHVTNLYIAQVKREFGIIERINYNVGDGKSRVPQVTPEKREAIIDALKYFQMIEV